MIARTKWIERKFNFDYPPGMFPYYVERLRGTPVIIEEITGSLSENQLSEKINSAWSIKEHIGHLIDLEELHDKRIDQFLANMAILLPADMSNRKTNLANHNGTELKLLISNLRNVRNRFINRLEKLTDTDIIRTAMHPRLNKEMRLVDLVYFAAEHDNHHITIIRELAGNARG
jgi:uncharacterized damage-inducible protein DinB